MYKEEFRKSLPIYQHREEILNLIKNNNYCIITGETGSGKTTQLPQYIIESLTLADFFKNDKVFQKSKKSPRVVITQPRRVAAIQMAKRVCYEKNYKLGNEIGYTIRFGDNSCENTIIKYVTDGILVKECLADNILNKYHVVIIDEAHERSLYSDILFALIKQVVKIRNGSLKLIIMSATLNTEQFIKYFNNCPLLKVSGKLYPVDITYHPSPMDKRVKSSVELAIRIHLHE
jgi:HrpA-like RNA helicase